MISNTISVIHKEITNKVLIELNSYLSIPHKINDLNKAFLDISPDSPETLERLQKYFFHQLSIYKSVNIIAFGTANGEYIEAQRIESGRIRLGDVLNGNLELWRTHLDGKKADLVKKVEGYDPRKRPWYLSVEKNGAPAWSSIYMFSSNNQAAISGNQSYSNKNSTVSGVLTTAITLSDIGTFLSDLSISKNSSVLLMEPSGLFIAATGDIPILDPENKRIYAPSLQNHIYATVAGKFLENQDKTSADNKNSSEFTLNIDNTRIIVSSTPYHGPNGLIWNVLVIINEADYMSDYYYASISGIIFLLLFLLIAIYASYLIARQTAKPIEKLSNLISQITWEENSSSEWKVTEELLGRIDEIGLLAKAFSGMGKRLNKAFYDIKSSEKKYRELIEGINATIIRLKPDGTIIYVNDYALNYFGYTKNELIHKKLQNTILPGITENGEDQSWIIKNIFDDNERYWINENENIKRNGERAWFLWSNKLITNEETNEVELLAIGHDITIRKKAEKELSTSLSEKSILLSEIHHRVKNNLQIITSLINLQLADISNDIVQETLSSLQNRIQSMALVHEMLYSNESFSEIDFYDYLYQITATISATHNRIRNPIKVLVEGENLHLDIERSTTCGLIVNELILNAFKHAFNQEQTDCKIDITIIKKEPGQIIIKVEDNGTGISTSGKSGMGTLLIEALTDQLNGKMEIKENNGTSIILTFKTEPAGVQAYS